MSMVIDGTNGLTFNNATTQLYGAKYDGTSPTITGYTWACQITYLGAF